ncbi:vWA-MoxR associated conflict system protein [Saccharothrix hoggarensis]|uniref:vWA-MoxR associated protein middle region 2 domain-containing protein n=1 Tax=Saccharothrix hoggarensis TaxID=913853 RepID=A0ABW3QJZ5_9PSEU
MIGSVPRRFVVIATQCPSAEVRLPDLERAAEELRGVLEAPDLGAATGDALIGEATQPKVEAAVRHAIAEAGAEGAVLVVALLGHGFSPNGSTLYYMAHDTRDGEPASGVDVGKLLSEAAQQPGIEGVIALVDTCYSASGVPDVRQVVSGVSNGQSGLAVMMSSASNQRSYHMNFTFALTDLARDGMPGEREQLYVTGRLMAALRTKVSTQTPASLVFDGGTESGALWLVRNRRDLSTTTIGSVGALGRKELAAAIARWNAGYALPATWTMRSLDELRDAARSGDLEGMYVLHVVQGLTFAIRAAEFLRENSVGALTTPKLRNAGRRAGVFSEVRSSGTALVVGLLEEAALRVGTVEGNPWKPLARLMAALAIEIGIPADDRRLREWSRACGLDTELNDAFAALAETPEHGDLRLVLAPSDEATGWPNHLRAWLLRAGAVSTPQKTFHCPYPTRHGTEKALASAREWALDQLGPDETLRYIDIAVPADVLADVDWHPEKIDTDLYYLGTEHDVLAQWSGRLRPSRVHQRMNKRAREAMRRIDEDDDVPLDWVTRADLHDVTAFGGKLKSGAFRRAIGIDHRPPNLADVLEMLLPYSPVLLWPSRDGESDDTWPNVVRQRWDTLPGGFTAAFREQLDRPSRGLANVRTAWHDIRWLDFCRWFELRTVRSENVREHASANGESES